MIAGDMLLARARPWLLDNSRALTRALAPALGLGLAWWLSTTSLTGTMWLGVIVYGLAHLTIMGLERSPRMDGASMVRWSADWLHVLADVLFALLLLNKA